MTCIFAVGITQEIVYLTKDTSFKPKQELEPGVYKAEDNLPICIWTEELHNIQETFINDIVNVIGDKK